MEAGEEAEITVSVDTTGMAPGSYDALVGIVTDDPDLGVATGPRPSARDEVPAVRERRWRQPSRSRTGRATSATAVPRGRAFGWVGASTVRTTDPRRSRAPRTGRSSGRSARAWASYRFTVPDGRYRVQLEFAELAGLAEFGRIMDVSSKGSSARTTSTSPAESAGGGRSR